MTDFRYSQSEFNTLLSQFQSAVECGEYTEKIAYDTWRKLKKLTGPIVIEYEAPFVKISYEFREYDGSTSKQVVYSTKTYENGFGRFFYDYVVKEKIRMNIDTFANDNTANAESASSAKSVFEFKADLMQPSDYCYNSTADKICTYDNDSTAGIANYGTSISDTVKINGDPISNNTTNAIEINVPSLDYYVYHQTDGTWDSTASKSEIETRFKKLEAELQKKVDKTEKNECVKENNTMMKGINFDFGPCGNTVRLSMYGMAIQNISGEWVSYNPDSREIINVDVFNMADGGKYMYKMPVAIADVKEGDIVIIKPYVVHKTSSVENQGYERLLIDFDEEYLKNLFMLCNDINVDELFEDEFCVLCSDIVNGSYLKELCSRLIFEKKHPDKNDKASINLLVGQALTVISRLNHETAFVSAAETKSYKRISEIISFIEENYYKKLSLEEISQKYYISYYYLSHAFREVTGLSFTEYVNTVRVSKARQMIKKDTYPLHVICDKTGFGSYKQFGRIFKEITGVSPSQYK